MRHPKLSSIPRQGHVPELPTGVRTPSVLLMLHFPLQFLLSPIQTDNSPMILAEFSSFLVNLAKILLKLAK